MDLDIVRQRVRTAIHPIGPATDSSAAPPDFLFKAQRTEAGRFLPPYYLIYFLLVDLLSFRDLGKFDKIAWSVPIDFEGQAYLIDHLKFGVGLFACDRPEAEAERIVKLICRGVKAARPYFEWLAEQAMQSSTLNVENRSDRLLRRFEFNRSLYQEKVAELERRHDERIVRRVGNGTSTSFPRFRLKAEADWLALSAIESFFSWTEHVFIHIGILRGQIRSGTEVGRFAAAEWRIKYRLAIEISSTDGKSFYDQLAEVRYQLRNFVTHGSFGKDGEAFSFHSGAGAVPLRLPHRSRKATGSFARGEGFVEGEALQLIDRFMEFMWSGEREPARLYIAAGLPLILTMVADGQYAKAMRSVSAMEQLVDHLSALQERSANMDF